MSRASQRDIRTQTKLRIYFGRKQQSKPVQEWGATAEKEECFIPKSDFTDGTKDLRWNRVAGLPGRLRI